MTIPTIKHHTITKRGTIIFQKRIEFIIEKKREKEMINDLKGIRTNGRERDRDTIRFDFTVRGDDLSFLNRDWPIQYFKDL